MKRKLLSVAVLALSLNVYASNDASWMRYPAISPDGTQIAFTFKGDVYTVPVNGGRATQITTNPAHDTRPCAYRSTVCRRCRPAACSCCPRTP